MRVCQPAQVALGEEGREKGREGGREGKREGGREGGRAEKWVKDRAFSLRVPKRDKRATSSNPNLRLSSLSPTPPPPPPPPFPYLGLAQEGIGIEHPGT
jgi:hypothetical protein